jgi:hypothetical protein
LQVSNPITGLKCNGTLFVAFDAVGNAYYSSDGVNWNAGTISYNASPSSIGEIEWNGSYWLVGGNGADSSANRVWKSYDGMVWSPLATITCTSINAMVWTGAFWIISGTTASGYATGISTDYEANNWYVVNINGLDQHVASLAHNGKVYVAVGDDVSNKIAWSYDAVNWTAIGNTVFDGAVKQVKWMGDRFIALGMGTTSRIASSRDGIRWTVLSGVNAVFSTSANCVDTDAHFLHKISFPENLVLSGKNYSRDGGATWTTISSYASSARSVGFNGRQFIFAGLADGTSYNSETLNGPKTQIVLGDISSNVIKWNGRCWLIGGVSNSGRHIIKSADGFNWQAVATGLFANGYPCNGIATNGKIWIASGKTASGAILAYSSNISGESWTMASSGIGGGPVEWNGAYFLCGGSDVGNNDTNIYISSDGMSWSNAINIGKYGAVTGVAWSGKSWVLSTTPANTSTTTGLLYSPDGVNWTPSSILGNSYNTVGWAGSTYVAITSSGAALYSYNGLDWSSGSGAAGGYNVAWTRPNEAAVKIQLPTIIGGSGTNNTMAYSLDGTNYRGIGKSVFGISCRSIAWNGDIWVAGGEGDNTLAYSYDGISWTGLGKTIFSTACYKVMSNGYVWVAMGAGTNTIATSMDGKNWTGLGTSIFDVSGISVDWNNTVWVAVGAGSTNTLATSSDKYASTWTGSGNALFSNMRCVKWMMKTWFIGADSDGTNTMASASPNPTNWTYVSNPLTTSCTSISWNGREAVAVGSSSAGTTVITSVNGSTWTANATATGTKANAVEWNGRVWVISATGTKPVSVAFGTATAGTITVSPVATSDTILTEGYCVGANSRIGSSIVPNNRLYLKAGERLTICGPESYDASILPDTSISMNLSLPV